MVKFNSNILEGVIGNLFPVAPNYKVKEFTRLYLNYLSQYDKFLNRFPEHTEAGLFLTFYHKKGGE